MQNSSIRVLLVDDDHDVAELTATYLERIDQSFETAVETSPDDGLSRLERERVDCIVSDYEMPGRDGLEFLAAVRERDERVPFVLFTGRGSEEVASEAISAGVTDYLQKSHGSEQYEVLANRVRNAVERARATERAADLNRVTDIVRRVQDALYGVDDRAEIERVVCESFASSEAYQFAWIGVPDGEGTLAPRAAAGGAEAYLDSVTVRTDDTPEGRGPGGLAVREREIQVVQDVANDPRADPWTDSMDRFDFRAVASIPIQSDESFYGVLSVYSSRLSAFSETECDVLERLGRTIAQAVSAAEARAELAAQHRELQFFEKLVDDVGVGAGAYDATGELVYANPAYASLVGLDAEELVGMCVWEVNPDFDVDRFEEYWSSFDLGETRTAEAHHRDGDGGTVPVSVTTTCTEIAGERYHVGTIEDVSERRARERELQRERNRFAALFEDLPEPTVEYRYEDGEPIVQSVNCAFEDTFGHCEADVVGQSIDDVVVPDGDEERASDLNERVRAGERLDAEVRRTTTRGPRDFLLRNAPVDATDGAESGYAIYIDVSERRRRERVMAALHEATRDLMESADAEQIARVAVTTAYDVVDKPHSTVFLYDDATDRLRPVATSRESHDRFGPVGTFRPGEGITGRAFARGETIVVDDALDDERARNSQDGPDEVRGYVAIPLGEFGVFTVPSADPGAFTETDVEVLEVLAANVQAALTRADRERRLRERESELTRQNERLEEFAGVLSHDLRNPLNVALGHVELAEDGGDADMGVARQALERMSDLVEGALTLARDGQTVGETTSVDVAEVATDAWRTVETASATLSVGDVGTAEADPERLRTLFENLFRNAVEHGGADVTVRVEATDAGFAVSDDGPGLPDADVFARGFTTGDGSGFGLAIVRAIAEAHGWELAAAESDDGGARFAFRGVRNTDRDAANVET